MRSSPARARAQPSAKQSRAVPDPGPATAHPPGTPAFRPRARKPARGTDIDTGRSAQKARTRLSIVEAARRLATSAGPVRVADVATEAGVSEATFYRYFRDVGAVLFDAMQGLWPGTDHALAPVAASDDAAERVAHAVAAYLDHVIAHRAAIRAIASSAMAHGAATRSQIRFELLDAALAPVRSQVPASTLRAMRNDLAALTSAGAVLGEIDSGSPPERVVGTVSAAAAALVRTRINDVSAP
jgi:AcrR family transcriptional regulator